MKKHLYRFFGCALILATAVMSGHATNNIGSTEHHKICSGETITLSTRQVQVFSDTILYDTLVLANTPEHDTIINMYDVNVYPPFLKDEYKRLQEGTSYDWQDTTIADPGVYERVYHSQHECDSIYRLTVTVYTVDTIDTVVTICPNTTFTWHGMTKGQTGVYEYPGVRANGDRVMYRLDLTVKELAYVDTLFTLCDEESVFFHGKTYVNAGEYYDAYTCDTTFRITIVKHPSQVYLQTGVLDRTNPYYWRYVLDGEQKTDTIKTPGVYEHTSHNETTGCNDTYRLILTKDETKYHYIENVTICESEPYSWRDLKDLNKQGIGQTTHYFDRYRTVADQDSIYELVLTVKPVLRTIRTIHFCGSMEWKGKTYTESTTIVDTTSSVQYSCDSISTTILSKAMPVVHKDTVVIVSGETLNWHGQSITRGGEYTDIRHSQLGCDTTFMLYVKETEPAHTIKTHSDWYSICQGDGQDWRDDTYYNSGVYYDTIKIGDEIDSLYIMYLTVNKTYDLTERVSFLSFPVTYRDSLIKQPGAYTFHYQSKFGCDSTITSYIDKDLYHDIQTVTICPGQSHIWDYDGETYSISGTYTKTERTKDDRMDSVVHVLNLTVRYIPETFVEETICKGQTYVFGDQVLTESDVYHYTFHKTGGCDSVVTLSLNVLSPDTTYLAIQRTPGTPYVWDGENIPKPGMYFHYGTNRFGCDSVSILNFTYNQVDTIADTITVCPNELPYQWNGIEANQTNHYSRIEQQPNGNYIFYSLDLTVRNVVQQDTTFSICDGSSITYNGTTYDVGGHYRTYISCDTLMNVHINMNQQAIYETHGSVTDDHGYTWSYINNGTPDTKEFKDPGTYEFENPNKETGCNDIYRLVLTKDESEYHFNEERTICEGDEFTWHGLSGLSSITGTKEYEVKYETRAGKDSIYHLTLTVLPTERTVRTQIFCDEITWNGKTYTEDAVVFDTTSLSNGCYRIERVNLDKATPFYSKEYRDLPQGSVLHWHGKDYFTDGTYYDSHTTVNGCDSIYELTITIVPAGPETNQYAIELSTCEGDTIPWRGKDIWRSGTYVDTVWKAGTGKTVIDTIYALKATIWPAPKDTIYKHMYTCSDGASIRYDGKDYYTDQEVVKNFKTIHGCDSIVKVFMHFNTATYLSRTDTITDKQLPYKWTYQIYDTNKKDTTLKTAGTYTHTVASAGGCTNQEELTLIVLPTYLYTLDTTICERDLPFKWLNGPADHVNDELTESKQYEYRYESVVYGTDSIYRLTLTIDEAPKHIERYSICENKDTLINGKSYFDNTLYPVGQVFRDTAYYPVPGSICDSIVYYEITKIPQRHIIETRILHENETIQWHGETIKDPISKTYTKEDEIDPTTGCEIIYQLRVIAEDRTPVTICALDTPYVWTHRHGMGVLINDSLYTTGLYTDTVRDAENFITEYHTLDLNVLIPVDTLMVLRGCKPEGVTWNGRPYDHDTIFRDTLLTCDTMYTVKIKVDTTYYFYYTDTVCEHTLPYVVQGPGGQRDSIYQEGSTIHPFKTACGCDSTVEVRLHIRPALKLYRDSVFLCEDVIREKHYILGDTVNPAFDPYRQKVNEWKGKWRGVEIEDDSIVYNCDSTKSFHVIVRPHQAQPRDTTYYLCRGDSVQLFWPKETWVKKDTIYLDTVITRSAWVDSHHGMTHNDYAYACDSVTRWTVIYADTIHKDTTVHIAMGDSLFWNNRYLYAAGNYDSIGQAPDTNSLGKYCKYVMTMHLFVDSTYYYRDTISVCEVPGKDTLYYWKDGYNQVYTMPDKDSTFHVIKPFKTLLYRFDSIYDMYIDYHRKYYRIEYDTICYGDSIQFDQHHFELGNNNTIERYLRTAGQYSDTLMAKNGCDSIIDLRLYVRNRIDTTYKTVHITDREVPYVWENKWTDINGGQHSHKDSMYITGTYRDTLPSIYGCDSVFVLNLIVHPTYIYRDTVDTCAAINETLTKYWPAADGIPEHKQEYTTPLQDDTLTYRDTVIINYPHDSVFYELYVRFHRTYVTDIYDTICYGDSAQIPTVLFTHPNTFYKKTGIYSDTVPSVFGCDSIIKLHLQVWPSYPTKHYSVDINVKDTPYLWMHTWMEDGKLHRDTDSISVAGEYSLRLPTIHGCDSVDSLSLRIHPNYEFHDTVIICGNAENMPYVWKGPDGTVYKNDIYETNTYEKRWRTSNNFGDSIRYLHFTVNPIVRSTRYDTLCYGDSIQFGLTRLNQPRFLTKGGVYYDTLTSKRYGCDSIIELRLNVFPRYFEEHTTHISVADTPYVWRHYQDGVKIDSTIIHLSGGLTEGFKYTFTGIHGCDSIDSLTLHVHQTYLYRDTVTICADETPYEWEGIKDIYTTNDYFKNFKTKDGYDSTHVRHIIVNPIVRRSLTTSICEGDSIQFGFTGMNEPRWLKTPNVYYDTLVSYRYQCDSIVQLTLNMYPKHISRYDVHIKDIDTPYVWIHRNHAGDSIGVDSLYAAGKHGFTFESMHSCDSIDTLTLYIHNTYKFEEEITICERQTPYTWQNRNDITESGTYIYNPRTHDGYDSIFIATITVQPTAHKIITEKICKNDLPFNFHDSLLWKGGIYIDTLASMASGCDSVVELHLTVNDPYYHFERRDIYEGDTCNFFGIPYTTSGTYTHSKTTPAGCDSITELMLVVHKLVDTTAVVCSNDLPFEWRNHWNGQITLLHTAGIYHNDTTYVNGERTFWSIELIVKEPTVTVINESICKGENNFFSFKGQKLTESGIYKDTLQTSDGCDSIIELHLTVNKPYYNYIERHIIEGQSVEILGLTFNKDTLHTIKELTADKCDSIIDIKVIMHPAIDTTAVVCSNDLPYMWINKWNGQITPLYAAGIYRNDTTYVNGERMFYGLKLVVNEPTSTTIYRSICEGSQYTFNGQLLSTAGEYRDTLRNAGGCDSIVVLHLNVEPTYYNTINRSIFEGDTVMFQGQPYSTAGIYPIRYTTTTTGCDSIIELRLTVNRLYDDSVTVCANELPLLWRGQSIYESGIYRDTVINSLGKETAIGLKVNVLPILRAPEPINKTICEGDFYKFGKNILTEQGTYYDTLTAANGCDSIVMLALTVIPVKYETITKRIFEGDSVEFNNVWYKESGVYEYRVTNNYGCTDTYQMILTVLKSFNVDTTAVICDTDLPFMWRGIEYNETGDYTMPISWTDSSRVVKTLHLTVNKSFYGERNISICAGDTFLFKGKQYYENGTFNDTIPSAAGCDSIIKYIVAVHPTIDFTFEKHISDKQPYVFHDRVLTLSGTYEWTGKTVNGCDSMEHLLLTVHPSFFRSDTFDLCQSDTVNFPFQWKDENGKLIMEIAQSGTYTDSILTEYGFDSVRQAVVYVHPAYFIKEQYEIGEGEHLKIHGRDISSPAIYYDTLRTIHGCDSIYHIVVNQKRTREFTWNKTICQGDYFDFFGRKLTQTGQYKYISQYRDSVVTLSLTVNPVTYSEKRVVVTDKITSYTGNDGKTYYSYIHEGMMYDGLVLGNNLFSEQHVNQYGCDSIARLVIVVSTHYSEWTPMPLCPGTELKIDGQIITEAGLYTFLRRSRMTGEMDSIWRVEVYDAPAFEFDLKTTMCDGDTLFVGDHAITRSGKQDVVLKTVEGCDSIFHLDITMYPSYKYDTTITIFDYQTYTWDQNHQTYNVAGRYEKTYPTVHDCDSIYVLNLNVIQTVRQSTEYTICEGQEYTWRGKKYTIEGFYTDTVNDAATYMSGIYTLHLIVAHPTYISNATGGEICADDKDFNIEFTYTGAKPTFYSIYYDQAAKDEGFIDVIDQPFLGEDRYATGFVPAKPEVLYLNHTNYVKPGTYTMSLVLDNGVCGVSRADNIELVVKYPSWIIEQNWNNIVVPLKKELNGGYEFDQVEWLVNGVRQHNNGKGYLEYDFRDGDEVIMSAHRKGENRAYETCPLVITINPSISYDEPILVYPTQAPRHAPRVYVDAPQEGSFEVIATTGLIVAHGNLNEGQTQITLPAISGIYFIRVHQGNDVTSHKVMIY